MGVRRGLRIAAVAAVALLPAAAAGLPEGLFPGRALLPGLRAGPRDPVTQGQLVHDAQGLTDFGTGLSGEVSVSGRAAVLRLAGRGRHDALVLGLEGGAFARFAFQVVTRELVNTDWVFAVPLVQRRDRGWVRVRYYHTSSHLGDEYQRRFGPASVNFSRDGLDLTVYSGLTPGLGVYGLAFRSVNSHPEERGLWELRAGVEWDPTSGALWQPFALVDVHGEEGADWKPRVTAQAGLWLPPLEGRPLRLALQGLAGPSPMGQFRRRSGRSLGLGLLWSP